jgi:hypothetical protein
MSTLLRVVGERDTSARRTAITDTCCDDVVFPIHGAVVGRAAIDAEVEAALSSSRGVSTS